MAREYVKIVCYETGVVYDNAWEAGKALGGSNYDVLRLASRVDATLRGNHIIRYKDYINEEFMKSYKRFINKERPPLSPFGKRSVKCVESGRVFESLKQAAFITGANANSISLVLDFSNRKASGYHWKSVNE